MIAMRALIRKVASRVRGRREVRASRTSMKRVIPVVSESEFVNILPDELLDEAECAQARDARAWTMPRTQTLMYLPDPEEYLGPEEVDAMAGNFITPRLETLMYIPDPEEYMDTEELDALLGGFDDGAIITPDSSEDELDD
eukprot:TRINITY_DN74037_c0_g1_i1.p1 TRINITY_DN74037_c0_g1~~TRINITY_DN74037_c0_g1_i1.p1  ORF type:complete len:159 (-),score=29.80 TRINITY_DN74037_c0_g1_i1:366-788(-)